METDTTTTQTGQAPADPLDELRDRQTATEDELRAIVDGADADNHRALNADEVARFDQLLAERDERAARITELESQAAADARRADAIRSLGIGRQPARTDEGSPYTPDSARNHGVSFVRDLWRAGKGDADAAERLRRNERHVASTRAISTTTGAGGEFVPPLWMEQEFVRLVRPGRKYANLVTNDQLPAGTDSINIPKLATGTAVAIQGTQNTAIQQTDVTTSSINSAVFTIAGGQTVSLQLVEQSPLNIDKMVLADLALAYATSIDQFSLSGTGSGQPMGTLTLSGTNAVTYTDASPAFGGAGKLYSKIQNAIQLIQTSRYADPTHIVMHPRRWAWIAAQADSSGRPLVLPASLGLYNALGRSGEDLQAEGVVGEIAALPVVIDPNIPTNLGAGTNQDPIIVQKSDDIWLWEGNVKSQAFEQTYAQNVSLFLRFYNYMSYQPARYPQSIAAINGTGLVAPTF